MEARLLLEALLLWVSRLPWGVLALLESRPVLECRPLLESRLQLEARKVEKYTGETEQKRKAEK